MHSASASGTPAPRRSSTPSGPARSPRSPASPRPSVARSPNRTVARSPTVWPICSTTTATDRAPIGRRRRSPGNWPTSPGCRHCAMPTSPATSRRSTGRSTRDSARPHGAHSPTRSPPATSQEPGSTLADAAAGRTQVATVPAQAAEPSARFVDSLTGAPEGSRAPATDLITSLADFRSLRRLVDNGAVGGSDVVAAARDRIQAARMAIVDSALDVVKRGVEERIPGVRLRFQDLGTPGFGSDRDVTLVAESANPDAPVPVPDLVRASSEAVRDAYDQLRSRRYEPDVALDTNFYTELHEGAIQPANASERRAISSDQTVVSLTEIAINTSAADLMAVRDSQLAAIDRSGAPDDVRAQMRTRVEQQFAQAEQRAAALTEGGREAGLRRARERLEDALQRQPPASAREAAPADGRRQAARARRLRHARRGRGGRLRPAGNDPGPDTRPAAPGVRTRRPGAARTRGTHRAVGASTGAEPRRACAPHRAPAGDRAGRTTRRGRAGEAAQPHRPRVLRERARDREPTHRRRRVGRGGQAGVTRCDHPRGPGVGGTHRATLRHRPGANRRVHERRAAAGHRDDEPDGGGRRDRPHVRARRDTTWRRPSLTAGASGAAGARRARGATPGRRRRLHVERSVSARPATRRSRRTSPYTDPAGGASSRAARRARGRPQPVPRTPDRQPHDAVRSAAGQRAAAPVRRGRPLQRAGRGVRRVPQRGGARRRARGRPVLQP